MNMEISRVYLEKSFCFECFSLNGYQYTWGGNKMTGNIAKGQELYYTCDAREKQSPK